MRKLEDPRVYDPAFGTNNPTNWVCADFINQMTFDFYGLSNIEDLFKKKKTLIQV